jgi:hypothetical protein
MSSELHRGDESDGESVRRDGRGQPRARPPRGHSRNSFGGSDDDDDDDDELLSLDSGSDDDEDDETSSEDLEEDVRAVALGPCEMDQATRRLTKDRQGAYRIRDLSVHAGLQPEMVDSEDDDEEEEEEEPQAQPLVFRQFVNAIESHRRIQNLRLMNGDFRLEGAFPSPAYVGHTPEQGDEDDADSHLPGEANLERLFRSVLPNHPSLTKITLFENWIHPRYVRVFMKSLAGSPRTLSSLKFDVIPLTRMGYRAIGKALQQNARIEKLVVAGCWADERGFHRVCRGAAENRHLQELQLLEEEITVQSNTLLPVVRPKSALKRLTVGAYWTEEAFAAFVSELRTNTVLERLVLIKEEETDKDNDEMLLLEELLHTYNFTLARVGLRYLDYDRPQGRIAALLDRNARVRRVHEALGARRYHVEQPALWPMVLRKFTTFPTLLYRFVRQANVTAFSDQVLSSTVTRTTKKRSRRSRGARKRAPTGRS